MAVFFLEGKSEEKMKDNQPNYDKLNFSLGFRVERRERQLFFSGVTKAGCFFINKNVLQLL